MRITKSKATDPTYHVIQDVKRDWKRSTEIIEKKIKKDNAEFRTDNELTTPKAMAGIIRRSKEL